MGSNNFNLIEVQQAVICADLSYYRPYTPEYNQSFKKLESNLGKKIIAASPFYKTDIPPSLAGYVIATEDSLTIAYHGTNSSSEVLNDLRHFHQDMALNNGDKITGHAGFIDEFLLSNESRLQAMKAIITAHPQLKYNKITYTGHSLGGAVATYASIYDKSNSAGQTSNVKILTFGSPGCLSKQGAEIYKQHNLLDKTLHIQLQYDPVTACCSEKNQIIGRTLVIPYKNYYHAITGGYDLVLDSKAAAHIETELAKENQKTSVVAPLKIETTSSKIDKEEVANSKEYSISGYVAAVTSPVMSLMFNAIYGAHSKVEHKVDTSASLSPPPSPSSPSRKLNSRQPFIV